MWLKPRPWSRKYSATNVSAVPLTSNITGAEPIRVTSHPLARPPSGEPPRNATKKIETTRPRSSGGARRCAREVVSEEHITKSDPPVNRINADK